MPTRLVPCPDQLCNYDFGGHASCVNLGNEPTNRQLSFSREPYKVVILFSLCLLMLSCFLVASHEAAARSQILRASEWGADWPFPDEKSGSIYCKDIGGGRKAVWLNGSRATYALNGQAMDWAEKAGLIGMDGGPWKKGREQTNNSGGLYKLIQAGLGLC
jgi:hypothetical protein